MPVPVDLSKLSDVVKMMLLKKLFDKLVATVNSIDTGRFVVKTKYDKSEIEKKQITKLKWLK